MVYRQVVTDLLQLLYIHLKSTIQSNAASFSKRMDVSSSVPCRDVPNIIEQQQFNKYF